MSIDLLGLVKNQLTQAAVVSISEFLGESQQAATKAVNIAVPTLLGGIMENASTEEGAGSLMKTLKEGGYDGSLLSSLAGSFETGEGITGILSGVSTITESLLGDKLGGVIHLIASASGIKKSSASSLLCLVSPVLLSVLGRQVTSQGLGLSGLKSLLMSQKEAVMAALPDGARSILDLAGLSSLNDAANSIAPNEVGDEEEVAAGRFNFWPWLLAAALLVGGWYLMRSCNSVDVTTPTDSLALVSEIKTDSIASQIIPIIDSTDAVDTVFSKKLSTGFELKGAKMGIESQLVHFIEDSTKAIDKTTWFNFDHLKFDTGKTTIKAESRVQIDNLTAILRAYPKVKLKIGGYTDNVGNKSSNLKLSADRALAVKAAIIAGGIDAKRLESEGYGPDNPVASNDTENGRAQNRRIAARLTAK